MHDLVGLTSSVGHALRVLLMCQQPILATGIQHALTTAGLAVVVGAPALTGGASVEIEVDVEVDVALLVPGEHDVAETVADVRRTMPGTRVVVMTEDVRATGVLMLGALTAGADGWVDLESSPDALARTIRAVARGEAGISRRHVNRLLSALRRPDGHTITLGDGRVVSLTRREQEVFALVSQGLDGAEVAARLRMAPSTARWHVAALAKKLGVCGRDEVASLGRFSGAHRDAPPEAVRLGTPASA